MHGDGEIDVAILDITMSTCALGGDVASVGQSMIGGRMKSLGEDAVPIHKDVRKMRSPYRPVDRPQNTHSVKSQAGVLRLARA